MFVILKGTEIRSVSTFEMPNSIEVDIPENILNSLEKGNLVYIINNEFVIKENPRLAPTIIIASNTYQSDPRSISAIRNAVLSMDNEETINWKMKDNSVQIVTREELKLVLKVIQARLSQRVL